MLNAYLTQIDLDNSRREAANQSGQEWIAHHPPPKWSTLAWENCLNDLIGDVPQVQLMQAFALHADFRAYTLATELAISYFHQELGEDAVSTAYSVQRELGKKVEQSTNPFGNVSTGSLQ